MTRPLTFELDGELFERLEAFREEDTIDPHAPVGKQPLPMRQDVVRDEAEQNQKALRKP